MISAPNDVIWKHELDFLIFDRKCFDSAVYPASKDLMVLVVPQFFHWHNTILEFPLKFQSLAVGTHFSHCADLNLVTLIIIKVVVECKPIPIPGWLSMELCLTLSCSFSLTSFRMSQSLGFIPSRSKRIYTTGLLYQ